MESCLTALGGRVRAVREAAIPFSRSFGRFLGARVRAQKPSPPLTPRRGRPIVLGMEVVNEALRSPNPRRHERNQDLAVPALTSRVAKAEEALEVLALVHRPLHTLARENELVAIDVVE